MSENTEKYIECFVNSLHLDREEVNENLKYQSIQGWDSIVHMELVGEIENKFDIMMETDDIIDFSSYEKGKETLRKYGVEI